MITYIQKVANMDIFYKFLRLPHEPLSGPNMAFFQVYETGVSPSNRIISTFTQCAAQPFEKTLINFSGYMQHLIFFRNKGDIKIEYPKDPKGALT